jgi:hypothetical protein
LAKHLEIMMVEQDQKSLRGFASEKASRHEPTTAMPLVLKRNDHMDPGDRFRVLSGKAVVGVLMRVPNGEKAGSVVGGQAVSFVTGRKLRRICPEKLSKEINRRRSKIEADTAPALPPRGARLSRLLPDQSRRGTEFEATTSRRRRVALQRAAPRSLSGILKKSELFLNHQYVG